MPCTEIAKDSLEVCSTTIYADTTLSTLRKLSSQLLSHTSLILRCKEKSDACLTEGPTEASRGLLCPFCVTSTQQLRL